MIVEERVGTTEGQEASRARPPGPRRRRLSKPPEVLTSRSDQSRAREVGGHVVPPPGRPAKWRPPGPTFQRLVISLRMEVKHSCYSCLQPALPELTAENRPWSAINRTPSPHL